MVLSDLIHTVSKTGGHLGSSLGVVELTVALHHVFNTPVSHLINKEFVILSICFGTAEFIEPLHVSGG